MDSLRDSDEEDGLEKPLQSHETYLCQGKFEDHQEQPSLTAYQPKIMAGGPAYLEPSTLGEAVPYPE